MNVTLKNGSVIDLRHAAAIRAYADSIRPTPDDYAAAFAAGSAEEVRRLAERQRLAMLLGQAAGKRAHAKRWAILVGAGVAL
jgi:hypothetical protein